MEFSITINMDNAAFDDKEAELERCLKKVTRLIAVGYTEGVVHDINGQEVGAFEIEGTRPVDDERIAAYWVQDPEGDNLERFEVKQAAPPSDARTDALRSAAQMNEDEDRDDPTNVMGAYVLAVEYGCGHITTEGA